MNPSLWLHIKITNVINIEYSVLLIYTLVWGTVNYAVNKNFYDKNILRSLVK